MEAFKSATKCLSQFQSAGEAFTKTTKIVTFNLNESMDQKHQAESTEAHEGKAESENDREEELLDEHIDEHDGMNEEDGEGEEEEDFDLVFPEQYHSDEAYKSLI